MGTIEEDGNPIPRSKLRVATNQESAYEETFLTMQTAIKALQKVDPIAICQQTALSRSKIVLIGVFDTRIASVGGHVFQKHEFLIDNDLSLLSLPLSSEMSDYEKECWRLQKGLLLIRRRLYIPLWLFCQEVVRLNYDDPLARHFGFARILALI